MMKLYLQTIFSSIIQISSITCKTCSRYIFLKLELVLNRDVRPRGLASASRLEIAASASRTQASASRVQASASRGPGLGLRPSGLVDIPEAKYRTFGHLFDSAGKFLKNKSLVQ